MKDLKKKISKAVGKNVVFGTMEDYDPKIEVRKTGSLILDELLGGGIAKGGFSMFAGKAGYGKTTIVTCILKTAQERGETVAFIDYEATFDSIYAKNIGLDLSKVIYCQPDNGNEGFNVVDILVDEGVDMIVIDSIPAARPTMELTKDVGQINVGDHSKLITSMVNRFVPKIKKSGTSIICINQVREAIGKGNGKYTSTYYPGGITLEHGCIQIVKMNKPTLIQESDEKVLGINTNLVLSKLKLPRKASRANVDIFFLGGFDMDGEIIKKAVDMGIINRAGGWYSYGENKAQGLSGVKEWSKKTLKEIEENVLSML